jgi:hypothetical protein
MPPTRSHDYQCEGECNNLNIDVCQNLDLNATIDIENQSF